MRFENLSIRNKILLGNSIGMVLMLIIALLIYFNVNQHQVHVRQVEHNQKIIVDSSILLQSLGDMENGERNFLITGDESFLETYNEGKKRFTEVLRDLMEMLGEDTEQIESLREIRDLHEKWHSSVTGPEIAVRRAMRQREKGADDLQNLLDEGIDKELSDDLRDALKRLSRHFRQPGHQEAQNLTLSIAKGLSDMESGERGFLVTGKDSFLGIFSDSRSIVNTQFRQLEALIDATYNRDQMYSDLHQFESLIESWQREAVAPQIDRRRKIPSGSAGQRELGKILNETKSNKHWDEARHIRNSIRLNFEKASNSEGVQLVIGLENASLQMKNSLSEFLISGQDNNLQGNNLGQQQLSSLLSQLNQLVTNDFDPQEAQDDLQTVVQLSRNWLENAALPQVEAQRLMNNSGTTFQDVVALVSNKVGKATINELKGKLSDFIEREEAQFTSYKSDTDSLLQWTLTLTFLGTIIILALAFSMAFFISRKISEPLGGLVDILKGMAQGDLSETAEVVGIDEMAQLGRSVNKLISNLQGIVLQADAIAQGDYTKDIAPLSEKDKLGIVMRKMTATLRKVTEENEQQDWLKSGQTLLSEKMRGELGLMELTRNVLNFQADYLNSQMGAFYLNRSGTLKLISSYAFSKRNALALEYEIGEGLVGQTALEQKTILITKVPDDYIKIDLGMGETDPQHVLVTPFLYDGVVKGVLVLGSLHQFTEQQIQFFDQVSESIAISIHAAQSRAKMKELLEATQTQAEKLESQQVELWKANQELEEQTLILKESEARLQNQQEELKVTNEELEEQTASLELQQREVQKKNQELEKSRKQLEENSKALEMSSKYKSEFLANMSHELRSPLNSMLLLSQSLMSNSTQNLSEKQVEFASTIHSSGKELLALINDILDLSKIEAGKEEVFLEPVSLEDLSVYVTRNFQHQVEDKGLVLQNKVARGLPSTLQTDRQRVEQIIKNFMSNAIKFTKQGSVTFRVVRPLKEFDGSQWNLDPQHTIAIEVSDTGTGIPKDKQQSIFEAFQQGDGSTSRRYGGTGLGLSISKELAKLLGGCIGLRSEEAHGATFTLYLPESQKMTTQKPGKLSQPLKTVIQEPPSPANATVEDDREELNKSDRIILVIEDDAKFTSIVKELAHENGFKVLLAATGEIGLEMAKTHHPQAIILDVMLPGINGWMVMNELKNSSETRHIPVHFISARDNDNTAMKMGAIGYLSKPVSREQLELAFQRIEKVVSKDLKNLLIVEDDEAVVKGVIDLIESSDVETFVAHSGAEALALFEAHAFDCIVLDIRLPDITGFEVLETLKTRVGENLPPVIVYTGKELEQQEKQQLEQYTQSILIKGVNSSERLLGEITLFLHRVESDLPEKQRAILKKLYDKELLLKDKVVLIVDDDARNLFALSQALIERGLKVIKAFDGKEALAMLEQHPQIDLVLMDIMMPEMDGYETMRAIRKQEQFHSLPIIALTAKAMKEDRHKCIEAGATDYLPKPVDTTQLLSLIRVWVSQ